MKKIEITLYEFNELCEEAQKRAIEDAREWVGESQAEIDGDSFYWTMKEMERVLGIEMTFERSLNDWRWVDSRWEDLAYVDLHKHLVRYINWVDNRVDTRKTYYLPFEKSRYYHPSMTSRKSNIVSGGYNECLTGEWTDRTFAKFMNTAMAYVRDPRAGITEFVDSMVVAFRKAWDDNTAAGYSDDNVRDVLENIASDRLYTRDGGVMVCEFENIDNTI